MSYRLPLKKWKDFLFMREQKMHLLLWPLGKYSRTSPGSNFSKRPLVCVSEMQTIFNHAGLLCKSVASLGGNGGCRPWHWIEIFAVVAVSPWLPTMFREEGGERIVRPTALESHSQVLGTRMSSGNRHCNCLLGGRAVLMR